MIGSKPGSKKRLVIVDEGPPAADLEVPPSRRTTQLDMLPSAALSVGVIAVPASIGDALAEVANGAKEVEHTAVEPPAAPPRPEHLRSRLVELPLDSLLSGRNRRDEVDDLVDLTESLRHAPQLQNILVRPVDGSEDKYEIIGGHRRVEALRQLGRTHVEARIFETDDLTAELYGLEENLRRKALANEGAALARAKELYEAKGATRRGGDRRSSKFVSNGHAGNEKKSATAQLAALTHKSERQVRRELKVAEKAVPELKQALGAGDITQNEAEKIAGRPPEEQRQEVAAKRGEKRSKGPVALLRDVERSLMQARKHLSTFREKTTSAPELPDLIEGLKTRVAAFALEVAELKSTAFAAAKEGKP